jgi:Na+-driven multidrug efflux pump
VIMNLFGIPLNLIVVGVFLSIKSLGVQGALACSTISLSIGAVCMAALRGWKEFVPQKGSNRRYVGDALKPAGAK